MLAFNVINEESTKTVVLVHGFTQSASTWNDIAVHLSDTSRVVVVDLPGHGRSSKIHATLPEAGDLLLHAGGSAAYVGYSLGARVVLHTALQHPERVSKLILCGANPGIISIAERAERKHDDDMLAKHIEDIGVTGFIDEWLETPLFSRLTKENDDRASRAINTASGLSTSLRTMGIGTQANLWPELVKLTMPVLIITGAYDEKFTEIGSRTARAIGANAAHVVVESAGHSVPLDQPDLFAAILNDFLR
jgi:2-succinyl-6-hydroxy-2,4-cyclohexadiene-1-carboxylate synthase